ncbi:MAG: nucleotidyltransferase domain-containing protein [Gammaproteobacteria bacterium]|nr:nucleotidyltransferase domain-containing protein [Gammaproteobacteria bacterium]
MRLSLDERKTIRLAVKEIFGEEATVFLFGSRVNDSLKGGDIDLMVQSETLIEDRQTKTLQLVARLQMRLGDQPIDIIVIDPSVKQQAIHHEAIKTGIEL